MTHKLLALTFVMGLLLTSVSQSTLLTYDYVGPEFSALTSPYVPGDRIQGSITIDDDFLDASGNGSLQAQSTTGVEPWLIDLSFNDGVKTINFDDLSTLESWNLSLSFSSLDLVDWTIDLIVSFTPSSQILSFATRTSDKITFVQDFAFEEGGQGVGFANVDLPFWDRSVAAVPEPTTLALFTLGLAGLGWAQRRKRKVA